MGDICRFLGMVNQMGKFIPNLAQKTKPLRDLLVQENLQQKSFEEVKEALITSPVLALFDPSLETVISADASSFGLGAVLMQVQNSRERKPVAYISRSMSQTEQRYAQIEKEALAFTWACERFAEYLIGLKFHIQTDHKPLVPLFSTKSFLFEYNNLDFVCYDMISVSLMNQERISQQLILCHELQQDNLKQKMMNSNKKREFLSILSSRVYQLLNRNWMRSNNVKKMTMNASR